jgi:broad specificity phosphatase PhoE
LNQGEPIILRPTRITLISHGATAASRSAGFPADEKLLEGALGPAAALRDQLAERHRLIAAPELRTRKSAEALGEDFAIDRQLADIDYGRWAGQSLRDVHEREPDGVAAWIADPDAVPHGGESIAAAIGRIGAWLDGQMAAGVRIVAVTHPAIVRAALVAVVGAPPQSFWKFDIVPWSLVEMSSNGQRWALRSLVPGPDRPAGGA